MSTSRAKKRRDSAGMTLVELAVVLAVAGGLGWGGIEQVLKFRMRVRAIEVKVLVKSLDEIFDKHVAEYGLTLPDTENTPLNSYGTTAQVKAGDPLEVPDEDSAAFDYLLSSKVDSWMLTVRAKGTGGDLMTCGYQYTAGGSVTVNSQSPWADYLLPTCLVADKPKTK